MTVFVCEVSPCMADATDEVDFGDGRPVRYCRTHVAPFRPGASMSAASRPHRDQREDVTIIPLPVGG